MKFHNAVRAHCLGYIKELEDLMKKQLKEMSESGTYQTSEVRRFEILVPQTMCVHSIMGF